MLVKQENTIKKCKNLVDKLFLIPKNNTHELC